MSIEDLWADLTGAGYSDAEAWATLELKYPIDAREYLDMQMAKLMREISKHLDTDR